MTPTELGITIDLRGYDFETRQELEELVRQLVPAIREDFPKVAICGIIISQHQQKLLRLELFMKGLTAERCKQSSIASIDGWPVTVAVPTYCRDCGDIHD